jgi:hypothetical protein
LVWSQSVSMIWVLTDIGMDHHTQAAMLNGVWRYLDTSRPISSRVLMINILEWGLCLVCWRNFGDEVIKQLLMKFRATMISCGALTRYQWEAGHLRNVLTECRINTLSVQIYFQGWRRYVPPKRRLTQDLHSATSQKTSFFIVTDLKASNLTQIYFRFSTTTKIWK